MLALFVSMLLPFLLVIQPLHKLQVCTIAIPHISQRDHTRRVVAPY
jgi:hypothetical protein